MWKSKRGSNILKGNAVLLNPTTACFCTFYQSIVWNKNSHTSLSTFGEPMHSIQKVNMPQLLAIIVWNWNIPSLSAMFNTQYKSIEKYLCNQSSHYEKYGQFSLYTGSHHVQPPNWHFSLSAEINKTQGHHEEYIAHCMCEEYIVHCAVYSSWAEVMLNGEKSSP